MPYLISKCLKQVDTIQFTKPATKKLIDNFEKLLKLIRNRLELKEAIKSFQTIRRASRNDLHFLFKERLEKRNRSYDFQNGEGKLDDRDEVAKSSSRKFLICC